MVHNQLDFVTKIELHEDGVTADFTVQNSTEEKLF